MSALLVSNGDSVISLRFGIMHAVSLSVGHQKNLASWSAQTRPEVPRCHNTPTEDVVAPRMQQLQRDVRGGLADDDPQQAVDGQANFEGPHRAVPFSVQQECHLEDRRIRPGAAPCERRRGFSLHAGEEPGRFDARE